VALGTGGYTRDKPRWIADSRKRLAYFQAGGAVSCGPITAVDRGNRPPGSTDGAPRSGRNSRWRRHHIVDSKAGFTTVVAVAFGPEDGLLYVLELSDAAGYPAPGEGKVVRVLRNGQIEEVITGLAVPTGMTFGRAGKLYISNLVAAPGAAGQILRFDITPGL